MDENSKKLFQFNYYRKEMPNLLVLYVYFHNITYPVSCLFLFFFLFGFHMCDIVVICFDSLYISILYRLLEVGRGLMRKGYCLLKRTHEVFLDYVNFFLSCVFLYVFFLFCDILRNWAGVLDLSDSTFVALLGWNVRTSQELCN